MCTFAKCDVVWIVSHVPPTKVYCLVVIVLKYPYYKNIQNITNMYILENRGHHLQAEHSVTKNSSSTIFTLNLTFNWVESSVAFRSEWNLSYCPSQFLTCVLRLNVPHLPVPQASLVHVAPDTRADRYGAGQNPNHHHTGHYADTHWHSHTLTHTHTHLYTLTRRFWQV